MESDAMRYIGRTVIVAAGEPDGTIVLGLDDRTVLRFFEDRCRTVLQYFPADWRRIIV